MSAEITVALVQICEPDEVLVYLPYTAGVLQTYVQAHAAEPGRYHFLLPQFQRKPHETALPVLSTAQVVGFSCYVWNFVYQIRLAKALKALHPEILIVFGGPHVPDEPAAFLAEHDYIDVCVHGEGEVTFLKLLEAYPGNDWTEIQGISFRQPDGTVMTRAKAERITDLSTVPSPYLSGVFEPLMAQHPTLRWCAVWETNRGCPFSCTFCDWGSNLKSKVMRFEMDRLIAEIDWFGRHQIQMVFCADANFGLLPRDLELANELVAHKQRYDYPQFIITQMTKNQPERAFETHRILFEGKLLLSATLSFQSVSAMALKAIKRENISLPVYQKVLKRFMEYGIPTYTDILIGLPGETFDSFAEGLTSLISMGQYDEMRFFHTYLLPNAEMAQPAYREQYGIETIIVPYYSAFLAGTSASSRDELYEMIVSTKDMPRQDWMRARSLAWLTHLFYFTQLMQLPMLLVPELAQGPGLSHLELLMAFFEGPLEPDMIVLQELRYFLAGRAQAVIEGQPESCIMHLTNHDIWLPATGFIAFHLLTQHKLERFYQECERLIAGLLERTGHSLPAGLLRDAWRLARARFEFENKVIPDFSLPLGFNLWECYRQLRRGEKPQLVAGRWLVRSEPARSEPDRSEPAGYELVPRLNGVIEVALSPVN